MFLYFYPLPDFNVQTNFMVTGMLNGTLAQTRQVILVLMRALFFFSGGPEISSQHEVRKEAQQEEFEVNNIVKI